MHWERVIEAMGGVTQLAARMGVSESTIIRWRNGSQEPPQAAKEVLNGLCVVHKVKVLWPDLRAAVSR